MYIQRIGREKRVARQCLKAAEENTETLEIGEL